MVEIGYTAMTMRKLAQRVGILPGSLYHHVDCKQDLLLNVVLDIVEKRLQAWHASVCPRDLKGYVCFSLERQVTVPQEDLILRHEVRHLETATGAGWTGPVSGWPNLWNASFRKVVRQASTGWMSLQSLGGDRRDYRKRQQPAAQQGAFR